MVIKMKSPNNELIQEKLKTLRLVPVVSLPSVEAGLKLAEILLRSNLPVAEITFRTACAVDAMTVITKKYPELLLLAGTVLTPDQVDAAVGAGAAAIVSPGFTTMMATYCREKEVPFFPGVCTPSEVQHAMEAGLSSLKFFPAENSGGLKSISLFGAIYQAVNFMPTGGINIETLLSYLSQKNVLCCGGTWLSPEQLMIDGKWDEIEARVLTAVKTIAT